MGKLDLKKQKLNRVRDLRFSILRFGLILTDSLRLVSAFFHILFMARNRKPRDEPTYIPRPRTETVANTTEMSDSGDENGKTHVSFFV